MKGSIRIVIGFLLVFGAVGGIDYGTATLTEGILFSVIGLGIMYSGITAMNKDNV